MPNRPYKVVFALAAAGLICIYWQQRKDVADLRREFQILKAKPANAEIVRIERAVQVDAAERYDGHDVSPSASVGEHVAGPDHSNGPSNEPGAERQLRNAQDALSSTFASERSDDSWAASSAMDLREQLTPQLPPLSRISRLDCKMSMCRIELVYRDSQTMDDFLHSTFRNPDRRPWNGAWMIVPGLPEPDGSLTTTVFMSREGRELPIPAPVGAADERQN